MAIRPGDTEPPFVLGKLVRFLQARAAPELFQKKPNSAEVAALRSRLTADKTTAAGLQLSSYIKDPHVVAEVLKQYLAALPDPIFTYDYYNSFMNVLAIIDLGDRLSMLRMLIYSLPPGYQSTALCLLELFHILHKSSIMDAEKLSLIFGPCFLRPEHQQAFMSSDNLTCCQLLQLIIEHGELIMRPDSSKMAALPPSPVRHLCLPIQRFNAIAISRKQGVVLPPDELPPLYSAAEVTNSSGPGQTSLSSASESPESLSSSSFSSSSSSLSSSSSSTSSPSPSSSSAALASPEGSMPSEPTLTSSTSFTSSSFDEQAGDQAVAAPLAEADLEVASEQPFDDTDLNGAAVGDSIPDITSFISVSVIGSPQQPAMSSPLRSSTSPSTLSPLRDEDSGLSLTTPTSSALLRVRGSEPRHVRSSSVNTEIFIPPDSPPLPPPPTGSPPAPGFLPSPDLDSSPLANDPLALRQEIASAVQLLGLCASKVKDSQISPTQLSQQLRDLNRLLLGTAVDTLRLDPNDVPISHEIVSQDELAAIDTASPVGELTKLLFEGLNEAASTLRFLEAKNTDKSEETVAAVCAKVNAVLRSVVA